ncbi:putative ribonuclease H-like domain-containing protein [Tanacetum coccineum]|uniref:Ribonuclease H-like domain-containing protein n=1 Tax=Tanacetum coccineum TaxID=301880 RepID=A0ABQ5AFW2_9ASTR
MSQPHSKRNFVLAVVLTRSGPILVNAAKQNLTKAAVLVNTVRPINTTFIRPKVNDANQMQNTFKKAHSHVKRPFYNSTAKKNSYYTHRVNTVRRSRVNTSRHTVKTARPTKAVNAARSRVAVKTARPKAVLKAVRGNLGNAIKASAYWVWRPKQKVIDHSNPKQELQERGIFDSGCSRHMTGNKSYLIDFEEIDGGFVAFGGNSRGGKISRKDFKLADENHVLLKVVRRDNMYSVDLKNIVPKRGLTCLYAKATLDEANLWHKRLGHTCVACQKGKQHRASCKAKAVSSICQPLQMLHMDLFATKDETAGILKSFITGKENLIDLKVKIIRSNNGTEFKNRIINEFCEMKGIRREYSVARIPQQNGVAERKNRTLIEAARTMLADSKLPITFWAKAVNTACYVQNRVLVVKPHNKTYYELFLGRKPALGFMRPFGCLVTILNTLDHLGKFDGKADEGFFIGYSTNSKAFRVFNNRTRIVEENLHVRFNENTPNMVGSGPNWLFDIDALTKTINYQPVFAGNQTNGSAGTKAYQDAGVQGQEDNDARDDQDKEESVNSINTLNAATSKEVSAAEANTDVELPDDPNMPPLENIIYSEDEEDVSVEADITNLDSTILVSPIPTTRIHKDHTLDQVIGDVHSVTQTRRMSENLDEHGLKVIQALADPSWIETMQEDLLQFQLQKVWTLVDLPNGKRAIGTKIEAIRLFLAYASFMDFTVYQMDVKSAFLYGIIEEEVYVCQPPGFEDPHFPDKVYKVEKVLYGLHQAPRAWYETLSTYLLDNGYMRGTIDKTLFIKKDKHDILLVQVYMDDIIFGSTKKSWCTEFERMMHKRFQMSSMGALTFFLGLQVKQKSDGIFISQDKYVAEILKKFDFTSVKTSSTPMESNKPLVKDSEAEDVDVHLYRLMIGSLMYLTASRPDIMFAVCACARFQVTPKVSHLHAVKRIFRYLKGQPKLGLWYLKDSPFDLEAYSDSDYAGASLDRKSTTREYVAAANCYGQVLWIQNQMLDYGFNFMKTKIYIDNESTNCIVKNLVFHSKTKHIEIRHHFIRDSYEKRLIEVLKIHTDHNVADLLTKTFDVSSEPINLIVFEAIYEEMYDSVERAATTATSLDAEQDSSNINRTQSTTIPNDPFS